MLHILLASASERRKEWLEKHMQNLELTTQPLHFEEPKPKWGEPVEEQVEYTCLAKAHAAAEEMEISRLSEKADFDIILVADTIVTDPDDPLMPLGKPIDEQHALAMLLRLSGNRHRVWSSTAIIYPPGGTGKYKLHRGWTTNIWTESAIVEFNELEEERIMQLISSNSWQGKAGAYDIAGAAASDARVIEGDELAVLGLAPSAIKTLQSL